MTATNEPVPKTIMCSDCSETWPAGSPEKHSASCQNATPAPADDLVRPALERIVSRLDSSGNYSSGASADVKIILAAITERDRRIAALTADLVATQRDYQEARDAHDDKMQLWQAAERRAEADAADAQRYRWLRSAIEREEFEGSAYISIRQDDEWYAMQPQQLDAAIDAAMKEQRDVG